jgi:hypothetical protein
MKQSEDPQDSVKGGLNICCVTDVTVVEYSLMAGAQQTTGSRFSFHTINVNDNDLGVFLGKALGRCESNSRRAASYDNNFASKFAIHPRLLFLMNHNDEFEVAFVEGGPPHGRLFGGC